MTHTILITGATGTVGAATLKLLADKDAKVRAGVHSLIKGERLKHPNVELCEIDFHRPETLEAAFTGIEKVFMITPFTENSVEMGLQLLEEAKKHGVKHIVRLSALGADAEPGIQLGRWHREVEKAIEESGIPYTFLRPNSFMQNFVNYQAAGINATDTIFLPLGQGKVSYIDTRDVAEVAAAILQDTAIHAGQAYELTGPEAISVEEVAHELSRATGRKISYQDVPEDAARQGMLEAHMPDWMTDAMLELNVLNKAGHAAHVTDEVEKLTGNRPRRFADFAEDYKHLFDPAAEARREEKEKKRDEEEDEEQEKKEKKKDKHDKEEKEDKDKKKEKKEKD